LTSDEVVASDLAAIRAGAADELAALSGRRLLVTGGAGFLGYYLVQAPLSWNAQRNGPPIEVTVVDNFARGVPDWLDKLSGDPSLHVFRHDVRQTLPEHAGHFDYVVHAAGIASPSFYRQHPVETMDANVTGLRLLLDRCVESAQAGRPVAGFLYFSSSEIYGDPSPDSIPTPETYRGNVSCTGPRACYDESKRFGETLCVNFARQFGVPATIARPFNNYGPGLKITDRRVIPDLARDIVTGRDIVLLSDGSATRTFCYASDAVIGYLKVLVRGRPGEPYNVGTESPEISMVDLAGLLADLGRKLLGYEGQVAFGVSPEAEYLVDNPNRRRPVIDKARNELGYEPRVELIEGLRRSLIWYAAHPSGTDA
jgi:dTDP-glucose 4,6-dehydratase/UDP-glucuronate decarboxylase